jgi:hypothetical protein
VAAPDPARDDFGLTRRQNRNEYFRTHRQQLRKKPRPSPVQNVEPATTKDDAARHTAIQDVT